MGQRADIEWLQKGDQNTEFFGRARSSRFAQNSFMKTLDKNGKQVTTMLRNQVVDTYFSLDKFNYKF